MKTVNMVSQVERDRIAHEDRVKGRRDELSIEFEYARRNQEIAREARELARQAEEIARHTEELARRQSVDQGQQVPTEASARIERSRQQAQLFELQAQRCQQEADRFRHRALKAQRQLVEVERDFADWQRRMLEREAGPEAREKAVLAAQIDLVLELLHRPPVGPDDLLVRALDDLRQLAADLEAEALRGAP